MPAGRLAEGAGLARAFPATSRNSGGSSSSGGVFILPNWTFFAELLLFLIVLGVVAKWILPPIQAALDERQRTVRGSLQEAEEHRDAADRMAADREAVLEGARQEGRRLLEEARKRVEGLRDYARQRAEEERQRRLATAVAAFEAERPSLRVAAMQDVERFVYDAAGRVLGADVDQSRHRELIRGTVRSVAAAHDRSVSPAGGG